MVIFHPPSLINLTVYRSHGIYIFFLSIHYYALLLIRRDVLHTACFQDCSLIGFFQVRELASMTLTGMMKGADALSKEFRERQLGVAVKFLNIARQKRR